MSKIEKILHKAKTTPQSLTISELISLTLALGFIERKSKSSGKKKGGSHHYLFSHPKFDGAESLMNYQRDSDKKSKAKEYQVKQLIKFLDIHPELEEDIKSK